MQTTATLQEVIAKAREGNRNAIDLLVTRFRDHAMEVATSLLGNRSEAEDAVQQAFVRATSNLGALRDPAAFAGWLRQIVRTECSHLRRSRTMVLPLDERVAGTDSSPAARVMRAELVQTVRRAIAGLPRANRDAIELYYLDERSCLEVASILQVPEGTVKRRLYDAREQLRQDLCGLLGDIDDRRRSP